MVLLAGVLATFTARAVEPPSSVDQNASIEQGRRIYQEGLLPGAIPLQATRPEGLVLRGKNAACAACHRRSGMGSFESTVFVPPIAGDLLFSRTRFDPSYRNPARFEGSFLDSRFYFRPDAWVRALTRTAYDADSLARVLRTGIDPDGKPLVAPMPRFALDDAALTALTAYLQQLSSTTPPGIDADTLHLATVIAPDLPAGRAESVVGVVQRWVASSRHLGEHWDLQIWRLSGSPDTWRAQLDDYYRRQPVFALLSGAGADVWQPVHRFCEARQVPCVLPSLDVAPVEEGGYYSVYFSPGVTLEARILAEHLLDHAHSPAFKRVVQVYADGAGRAAAAALASRLSAGGLPVVSRGYRVSAPLSALNDLGDEDALVLWLRPDQLGAILAVTPARIGAGHLYLSALLAPPEALRVQPAWRSRVSWISLFDDLDVQTEIARLRLKAWLEKAGLRTEGDTLRPQADAFAACYLLYRALQEIRAEEVWRPQVPLGREHVLEELETVVSKNDDGTAIVDPNSRVAFYGRMSLAADQRVAVRGGSLLGFADANGDRLVAQGARIVP